MVAPDDRRHIPPRPIDGEVWVSAVSDQVTQAQDLIVAALRVVQHSLKRLAVSMDVAQDQVGHSACRSSRTSLVARRHSAVLPDFCRPALQQGRITWAGVFTE